jgi:RNA recognition motif-containing protein
MEGGDELNWQQQELMSKNAPSASRCDWGDSEAPCDAPPRDDRQSGGGKGHDDRRSPRGGGGGSWGKDEQGIKLYVGNLSWQTTRDDLGEHFASIADVLDVVIVENRETGSSRGFGFVYMDTMEGAQQAIEETNEREFMGRNLRVNIAEQSGGKGRGGNRSYGFGGGDRGGYGGGYDDHGKGGHDDHGKGGYGDRGERKSSYGEWDGNNYDRSNKYGGTRVPEGRWR